MEHRKVNYWLSPSKTQAAALRDLLLLHQRLYNGTLEQSIDAWRRRRVCLTYADQCRELTDLRRECPEFATAFATLALPDGTDEPIPNPRLGQQAERDIRVAARSVSRKRKGSNNRCKAVKTLARLRQRLANRRRDFAHKQSTGLIKRFAMIATEELNIKTMTSSAKGAARY